MIGEDQDLERKIAIYKQLSEQNKNVDVASLMITALQEQQENKLTIKDKTHAYLVSIVLPPFGLIYVIKFIFSDKKDAKITAIICVILTMLSIAMFSISIKGILSGSGASLNQIEQIKPQDIYQLSQ